MWGNKNENRILERIAKAIESIDETDKKRLAEDEKQTLALQGIENLLQPPAPGVVKSFVGTAGTPISKKE